MKLRLQPAIERGGGGGDCTVDTARQGSKATKKDLRSLDPGFKFPGPITEIFPRKFIGI